VSVSASEVYRVERTWGTEPVKRGSKLPRAIGTALTGLPLPGKMPTFEATVRIVDQAGTVVYSSTGPTSTIDALELEILNDLIRLDVEAFRRSYGIEDDTP